MAEKDKKGIFDKVTDLFSDEDEKKETEQQKKSADRKEAAKSRESRLEKLEKSLDAKKTKIIDTHTVQSGETLSHVALKYYNHATPPYWKYLLEHNKEALKGNERNVREGMELEIPELTEELKD